MKKKKLFALGFFLVFFSVLLVGFEVQAVECSWNQLCYKPNVPIPVEVNGYNFAAEEILIENGDFLASYIVAIYIYGARFAGILAMFMLVIAGWRWLMAGGNAQQITEAKQIVQGVLLGLALLFGGQLLLSQISDNFDSIKSLDIVEIDRQPPPDDCIDPVRALRCGDISSLGETDRGHYYCLGSTCTYNEECIYSNTGSVAGYTHKKGDICDIWKELPPDTDNPILSPEEYFKCECKKDLQKIIDSLKTEAHLE